MSRLGEGSQLGRYRILRRLGAGAMGEVYLAEDPQIGRQLALKTVRVEEGKPQEVEDRKQRLLREARAAGKLLHPQIVTLFDAGEDQGLLYLAFEFVDGSDVATRLDCEPPLTLAEALAIVRQAAEGLDFAHRQGIVHRDIKPSNLMLTADGRVKVADFGIAKMLDATSDLTTSGAVVGSPHYLSPEQIRGEALDGRTDIFSLGVMLYEMLCRQRPFDGTTLTTLVYQILNQDPTPIEVRRPGFGPRIERLVQRMMHKERERRFISAAELAAEIRACERELAPELLARSLAETPELAGATLRLPPDATTAGAPPPVPTASLPTGAMPPPPLPPSAQRAAVSPATSRSGLRWIAAAAVAAVLLLVAVGLSARRFAAAADERRSATAGAPTATPAAEPSAARSTAREPSVAAVPSERSSEVETRAAPTAGESVERPETSDAQNSAEAAGEKRAPFQPGQRAVSGPLAERAARLRQAVASGELLPPPQRGRLAGSAPPTGAPEAELALEPAGEPAAAVPDDATASVDATLPVAAAPPPDPRAMREAVIARMPVARELDTAMTLSIEIVPKQAAERIILRLDRIVLGRAAEWNASKRGGRAYLVPEPGLHILSFVVDGADVYRVRIDAQPGRIGPTRVQADLSQVVERRRRPGGR
ncbi:MAG TPA: protein kinase [Thermoanaerobaculia bacterium]